MDSMSRLNCGIGDKSDQVDAAEAIDDLTEMLVEKNRMIRTQMKHLDALEYIGKELAGHITRPVVLSLPFDRDVLRHWAEKMHLAIRELNADEP